MQISTPSSPNNGRSKIDISTEFMTNNLQQDEYTIVAGTGATLGSPGTASLSANHIGVLGMSLPATTAISLSVATLPCILLGTAGDQAELVLMTGSTFPTTITHRFGFVNAFTNAAVVTGAYFELVGAVLTPKVTTASASTAGATLTLAASTWYHFRITAMTATTMLFEVYSDAGALLLSVTLTTPTTVAALATGYVLFTTAAGTAAIYSQIDYIGYRATRPISRGAP